MQRLRALIDQHHRWNQLSVYADRIDLGLIEDFTSAVENAKALLESIGKEICREYKVTLENNASVNKVIKNAFQALKYPTESIHTQVSGALANIAQQMGDLRNDRGISVHGRTMEEIAIRNDIFDEMTREFLIDATITVAILLIRAFEIRYNSIGTTVLEYEKCSDFNDYWDDMYPEFPMGDDYRYPASEVLFNVDKAAYETEYNQYTENPPQDEQE